MLIPLAIDSIIHQFTLVQVLSIIASCLAWLCAVCAESLCAETPM